MRKIQRSAYAVCLLLCGLLFLFPKTYGQNAPQTLSVTDALNKVTKELGTQFVYDPEALKGKTTATDLTNLKSKNVEDVLKSILYPNQLVFLYVKANYYTIVPKERVGTTPETKSDEPTTTPTNNQVAPATARTITGTVVSENGQPVAGASITAQKSGAGTSTNNAGQFTINIQSGDILNISSVGFQQQSVAITNQSSVRTVLQAASKDLDQVVVIGYGAVKKKNLVGSVASIGAKEIQDRPITRVEQAMAAQMPGVQVQSISGTPGAALQIRVRGAGSVSGNNEPIYVLDGIIVNNINDLDPTTIESIDVLKDGASAAIYGSSGSNGVVLITTKKGRKGKPRVSFSANTAIQHPEQLIKMLSSEQWIQFRKDLIDSAWVGYGRTLGRNYQASDNMDFRAAQLGGTVRNTHDLANTTYMYDPYWQYGSDSLNFVDWQKVYYDNPALLQRYNLSASGGSDNGTYLIAGEYMNQNGMVDNTSYKRYTFRSNLESKFGKVLTVGLNLAPSISWQDGPNIEGRTGNTIQPAGYTPVIEKSVSPEMMGAPGTKQYRWMADVISPMYYLERIMNKTVNQKVLTNIYANLNLYKGLTLNINQGINLESSDFKFYLPTDANTSATRRTSAPGSLSTATHRTSTNQKYQSQVVLNYDTKIGEHQITALAGASYEQNDNGTTTQSASKFATDNIYTFDFATSTTTANSTFETQWKKASLFGRVMYNFKERYLLSASLRRDGTSRFAQGNRYANFPAASIAWRISDESFLSFIKPVAEDIKIRYSYGKAGNDRISGGDYPYAALIGNASYSFNGAQNTGYAPSSIYIPSLTWESLTSHNIGIDATLLKNRIFFSFDYFNKTTTELLLNQAINMTTGFTNQNSNVGSVKNSGWEVNLSTTNIRTKDFTWATKFNYSNVHNKVLALSNGNTPLFTGWESTVKIEVGQPLYSYYLYDAIGVYQTPESLTKSPKMTSTILGDPMYRDVNGDGKITSADITNMGSPIPTYYWGLTNNFTYKRFDLSVLLQGQGGNKIFSMFGRNINRPTTGLGNYTATAEWANRFRSVTSPGDGKTPRIDATTAGLYDTRWLYDGDFWKIKNLTLGYNLKPNLIKGINSARFYISIDNLWMHDNYTGGYSPEAFQYDYLADWSSYPTAKTYSLGVNIGL